MKKILFIAVILLSLMFFMASIIIGGLGESSKSGTLAKATGGGACTNSEGISISYVPSDYMPYVSTAAQAYLKGDSLALIAVIKIESTWNPKASNDKSSASGLGQFITSTAKGYPEFVGGKDASGKVWPEGKVYDDPKNHEDDSHFDAQRAIFATAHLLSTGMDKSEGDLFKAYSQYYHTYGNTPATKDAAIKAGDRVVAEYNKLKATAGADCTSATAAKIVQIAHQQLGLSENPSGSDSGADIQKFLGNSKGEKWCADFVSWTYKEAGLPLTGGVSPDSWRIAGALPLFNYFKAHGVAVNRSDSTSNPPQPGDVVYFNFSGQDHVGIVESIAGTKMVYISGNTTNNNVGIATVDYKSDPSLIGWGRLTK